MLSRGRWLASCVAATLVAVWPFAGAQAAAGASPAWRPLGPQGGSPSVIVPDPAHPDGLYIGTPGGGMFQSADGGATWKSLRFGPSDDITAIVLDPASSTTIYGAGSKGVFKTVDNGASWVPANDGLPVPPDVADLVIDPADSQVLFASSGRSVYKTTDGGATWQSVGDGLEQLDVFGAEDLAVDPSDSNVVYLTVQYRCEACWSGGVVKSTDGGATWNQAQTGLTGIADYHDLLIDPSAPNVLYAQSTEVEEGAGGVYKSSDGGAHWGKFSAGLPQDPGIPILTLALDPSQPSVLYAGVDGHSELYRTADGAATWTAVATGLDVGFIAPVVVDPGNSNVLYAGTTEAGVYRSDTAGTSWTSSVTGITNTVADDVAVAPSDPSILYAWIEGGAEGDGVYRSGDGGQSWVRAASGLPSTVFGVGSVAVDPSDPDVVYATVYGSGVYKTTNGGASWSSASSGLGDLYVRALVIDPIDPQIVYVAAGLGLFKTTDAAQTWQPASVGLGTYPHVSALAIDASNPQTLFASSQDSAGPTYNRTVYATTDGASTWHLSNAGMEAADVVSVTVSPTNSGILFAGTTKDGVYASHDGGATWRHRTSNLFGFVYNVTSDPGEPLTAYVGTLEQGVWRTRDGGLTWSPIKRGLTSRRISRLVVTPSGDRLFAATRGGGVFGTNL